MEIYIIELPKFERYQEKTDKKLNSWVKFIDNPEEVDMKENKEVGKAKKILEEISQDEHERYLTELRQKYIMDQKAIEDAGYDKGFEAGEQQGIRQGIQEGIQQGKEEQKIEMAKKMLEKKMSIKDIMELTGLTEDEIKKL